MSHSPAAGGTPGPDDPTPPVGRPSAHAHLEVDGTLQPGTMVGEFRIESLLGAGGMATVYAAIQPLIGKKAAVKVITRHLCMDPVNVDRFVQEARAANQIGHPNIVDAFAFGVLPDGRSYLIMEWLQGETLAARLKRGPMEVPEALAILFQMCEALAACHEKGIVHRDLKPENVFLVPVRNRRIMVKLLDFGVAKLRGPYGESTADHTAPGATVGTPKYMAPEQARGKEVDYRADVYALGVSAYEMFTGRVPFLGADAIDVMHQHVYAMPPAPSTIRADLPVQIERLLLQMLEKRADKRPTLMQVEARLADVRDALAVSAPPVGVPSAIDGGPTPRPSDLRWPTAPPKPAETDVVHTAVAKGKVHRRMRWLMPATLVGVTILGGAAYRWLVRSDAAQPAAPQAATSSATTAATTPNGTAPNAATTAAAPNGTTNAEPAALATVATPGDSDAPATLLVTVNAPGARIELDGKLVVSGARAARVRLPHPGAHRLVVGAPHYRTLRRDVDVRGGGDQRVDVTLDPTTPGATPAEAVPDLPPSSRPHHRDDMIDPFGR